MLIKQNSCLKYFKCITEEQMDVVLISAILKNVNIFPAVEKQT